MFSLRGPDFHNSKSQHEHESESYFDGWQILYPVRVASSRPEYITSGCLIHPELQARLELPLQANLCSRPLEL